MFEAILVIYIYAGMMAEGDSVTVTSIHVPSMAICEREAKKTKQLVRGTKKEVVAVCLDIRK